MQSSASFSELVPNSDALAQQLQFFAENGYVVLRNVVPRAPLAELSLRLFDEFSRLRRRGEMFTGGGLLAGHINCFPGEHSRFALEALERNGVVRLIRALAPAAADSPRIGCNLNFPNSVAQNWHIDGDFNREFMIANIAVVDTDLVNGATDLLPGSHKSPQPFWKLALSGGFRSSARLELAQGDVFVRTSRLWHRGMPNQSATARPMIGVTFGEDSAPKGDPFLTNGGAIGFFPNRFRTNALGQLRERAYVAAPIADTGLRLVRSLLGREGYG